MYNAVAGSFIARTVSSSTQLEIATQHSAVIVYVPSAGKATYEGSKMLVDGIVVDYKFQQKKIMVDLKYNPIAALTTKETRRCLEPPLYYPLIFFKTKGVDQTILIKPSSSLLSIQNEVK